jgi:hypothetical protein
MKIKFILGIIFLSAAFTSFAQKALPIDVDSLLMQIPSVKSSATSFQMCTVETNNDGLVSVKDAGSIINGIQDQLMKYTVDLGNSTMSSSYTNTSAPSQEQINQSVQNAMQMQSMSREQMMQMAQNKHSGNVPQPINANVMKEFGQAQNAVSQLSILQTELATKASQLDGEYKSKIQAIPTVVVNCKEYKVQGADLALPQCSCVKALYSDYYQKRITIEDEYLKKLDALLGNYFPKFKEQITIIDKVENDLSYGDAITMPVIKRQVVGAQQQALSSLIPLLGVVGHAIKDSGSEYTGIVNTNNGHLPVPCQ